MQNANKKTDFLAKFRKNLFLCGGRSDALVIDVFVPVVDRRTAGAADIDQIARLDGGGMTVNETDTHRVIVTEIQFGFFTGPQSVVGAVIVQRRTP